MYAVNDPGGGIFILRLVGEDIYGHGGRLLGYVRNGVVCDKDGSPTRAIINGANIDFPQKGSTCLVVEENNVLDTDGELEAVVVGTSNQAERMIAAAAYWEFVWSQSECPF